MKTLEEIKNEYAKANQYDNWTDFINDEAHWMVEKHMDNVCETYAKQFSEATGLSRNEGKIKCYTVESDGSKLTDSDLDNMIECLKTEIENLSDTESLIFEFGVEYHTQEEIDAMPDFAGF